MSHFPVIASRYLPARMPIWQGAVLWLVLDRTQAPGWVCGVAWSLFAVLFLLIAWLVFCGQDERHPADIPRKAQP